MPSIYKPNRLYTAVIIALSASLLGCFDTSSISETTDTTTLSSGSADLSIYVSFGDSLTAGYADGTVYLSGQENSFPNILATQFALAGGGTFTQPLVRDDIGGLLVGGTAVSNTRFVLADASSTSPVPIAGTPSTDVLVPLTGSFNNMGVPGAKSFHALAMGYGYRDATTLTNGAANPYFAYFASDPSSSATMIDDAVAQTPTFFTLWIGANDVLSYSTGGGTGSDQLGNYDPTSYGSSDITDPIVFANTYNSLISSMLASGGKGVLVNIPDVSSIPYFTTVSHDVMTLTASQASDSNSAYIAYNSAIAASSLSSTEIAQRTISFSEGVNALVIEDDSLTDLSGQTLPPIRQATADDYIILPTAAKIGTLADADDASSIWGLGTALIDADVLTASEAALVATAQAAYNSTIATAAAGSANLLMYDAKAAMQTMQDSGINYGSGTITAQYIAGGGFSLDGVHPTARGYAVIANDIIEVINQGFSANIPKVDPGDYSTIFYQ